MGAVRVRNGFLTALAAVTLSAAMAVPAAAAPHTTVSRTIQDCNGDNLLDSGPGEEHLTFPLLGMQPSPGGDGCQNDRAGRNVRLPNEASILNFLQLSDFQMVDEESPARVEFLDFTQRPAFGATPFASAYRPHESLTTQVTEAMVRAARNATSPITGEQLELTVLTGDNADSQQYNETRWFIDILDGTTGSENPDPEMDAEGSSGNDRKIDPDSGIESQIASCDAAGLPYDDNDSDFDGARDGGGPGFDDGYYEPDSSSPPNDDGDGYSPDRRRNQAETPGRDVTVRDFPGLLEDAQERFEAVGLDMPWYSAFGNHDALVQGNSPEAYVGPGGVSPFAEVSNPAYHAIATGCIKPTQLPPALRTLFFDVVARRATPAQFQRAVQRFFSEFSEDPDAFIRNCLEQSDKSECDTAPLVVPPDPRRCFLAKAEPMTAGGQPCDTGGWIEQHFRSTGSPPGHGFAPSLADSQDRMPAALLTAAQACASDSTGDACPSDVREARLAYGRPPEAVANHDGYYSFSPQPGLRFLVLDTVTDECGTIFCSEGSVDDDQFNWMRDQIRAAAMQPGGPQYVMLFSHHTLRTTRQPIIRDDLALERPHYGQRVDRRNPANPQNPGALETLEELYCRNPNVIAHISGHEHENYVEPYKCAADNPPAPGPGSFLHVSTAAHIDWPQQARMIELLNVGGRLSLALTMLDHDGPANPGNAQPCHRDGNCPGGLGEAGEQPVKLAAIGREIGYNDYQNGRGSRGSREDRNVIVETGRPWPPALP